MLKSLPPFKSLLALEAVVRLGSVSAAASELGVTQPAISQQLRVVEEHFGRRLIERRSTGMQVGPDVEQFAARLRRAVEEIRAASTSFAQQSRDAERTLTIAVLATFAQRWLIPRLSGFQDQFPEIDIRLITTSRPEELARDDVDLSIRCGNGYWEGHKCEHLVSNQIFPVASKAYVDACSLSHREDLGDATLIRVDASPRDRDWSAWFEATGSETFEPKAWQTYTNSTQAIEAAIAGMGVAMVHTPFVIDSLDSGQLVKPFADERPDQDGDYFLVFREQRELPRRIALFRSWFSEGV